MRQVFFKAAIAAAVTMLPLLTFAADSGSEEIFKKSCVKAWMERAGNTSDKVEFQNFGERYCACASDKPLNNDAEMDRAARTCISQTMLQTTMNTLEEGKGLDHVTQADVEKTCQNKWKIVYPGMSSSASQRTATYCKCAATPLMDLVKNKDDYTDQQWSDKINSIALDCAGRT